MGGLLLAEVQVNDRLDAPGRQLLEALVGGLLAAVEVLVDLEEVPQIRGGPAPAGLVLLGLGRLRLADAGGRGGRPARRHVGAAAAGGGEHHRGGGEVGERAHPGAGVLQHG
ncbi:hypothetical protein D3C78_1507850 [compost metagenome]